MKKFKYLALTAVLLSFVVFTACGTTPPPAENTPPTNEEPAAPAETPDDTTAEVSSGATVSVTTDFATLQDALKATGDKASWIAATSADVDASGQTLTVDGHFADPHGTDPARKLALYTQNEDHQVTASFTLTVDKLVVNSPGFYIANGTVKGDVEVNEDGFKFQAGKDTDGNAVTPGIDGNLTFSTQAQLDAFNALDAAEKGNVTGTVSAK
jgi:hypothetical protein